MTSKHFWGAALIVSALLAPRVATAQVDDSHSETELEHFEAYSEAVRHASEKLRVTLEQLSYNSTLHPSTTDKNSGLWDRELMDRKNWTSGFFAGNLWQIYNLTGDEFWKQHAVAWTEDLESEAFESYDHDTGFRIMSSFGKGYETLKTRPYYRTILQGARTLSNRFNSRIGAIQSWNWIGNHPVIIDNLMNLEILLWASEQSGNRKWREIAESHARLTMQHHLRTDGSTYHIVDFSDEGQVNWKNTRQGYSAESVWARGQAWAIYGFTMIYRFTEDPIVLDSAIKTARYFIERLPEDRVPPYDFLEPEPINRTKDASAAAITASALFELYRHTEDAHYFNTGVSILDSLASRKYSTYSSEMSSILNQTTIQRGDADVGSVYADYYYLEAILRYAEIMEMELPEIEASSINYLDQNQPNPFNNSTTIYYSVEEPGEVSLTLYNSAGQRVRTLINGFRSPGTYRYNLNSGGLPSGVYFYRLQLKNQAFTRKMILLK